MFLIYLMSEIISFTNVIGCPCIAGCINNNYCVIIGCQTLLLIAPPKTLLIAPPLIIPHLKLEAPKQLLIAAPSNEVSVFYTKYDKGLRCLVLYISNPNLVDHQDLLKGLFKAVTTHKAFVKFGTYKSIIVSAVMFQEMRDIANSIEYNFHHNVLFKPSTIFDQYYREE